ncbi:MAG: DUF1295 domain-containing protein [Cyclobacteriaceae bacterium]
MSSAHSEKQKAPIIIQKMSQLNWYLSHDLLGGPKLLPLYMVINLQKFGTFFFVAWLMYFYDHYSMAAWVYLGLHGSYGFIWLMKHFAFPDNAWEAKSTFAGLLVAFLFVLGPYWVAPYLLISGVLGDAIQLPSAITLMVAIVVHTLGVGIMMSADAQKHFTLKLQPGLITSGMFRYIRHPNYTGEMMIYGSYALLVGHWIPWAILAWVWLGLFMPNILMKEASMSRHHEWKDYKKRSKLLIPGLF